MVGVSPGLIILDESETFRRNNGCQHRTILVVGQPAKASAKWALFLAHHDGLGLWSHNMDFNHDTTDFLLKFRPASNVGQPKSLLKDKAESNFPVRRICHCLAILVYTDGLHGTIRGNKIAAKRCCQRKASVLEQCHTPNDAFYRSFFEWDWLEGFTRLRGK